jgi:uncharacterized protein (UPF0548 family)
MDWVKLCWPDAPVKAGVMVGVLVRHFGFWSLNASRIVYVIGEHGSVEKCGFAYGTLPEHSERGEERFTVEWRHQDDSVWYDLYAFSRPQHILARAGYAVSRVLQRRFARESKQAMVDAVRKGSI